MNVLDAFLRWLCKHDEQIIRTRNGVLFTECFKCGKESSGVSTGGHEYVAQ